MTRNLFIAVGMMTLALVVPARGDSSADTVAIRQMMSSTWNKPDVPLVIDPVTLAGDYAIAGWTQGSMGGRALLKKTKAGWTIVLCAGDQLREATTLKMAGVPAELSAQLLARLRDAESSGNSARIEMFSRFEGLVSMQEHNDHAKH